MPGNRTVELHSTAARQASPSADHFMIESRHQLYPPLGVNAEFDGPGVEIRTDPKTLDVACGERLQPHRLPDTRSRCVEDRFRYLFPVLLAARDRLVGEWVLGAYNKQVVASPRHFAYIGAERRMAAFVPGDLDVVDPYGCAVVDRTEMQLHTFSLRRLEPTPVPDDVARQLTNPGQL